MNEDPVHLIRTTIDTIYRAHSRHIFATLIRLLGGFELAEEALHDAFKAALEQWPRDGVPDHPEAWLITVGRFKGIDRIRRASRLEPLEKAPEPAFAQVDPDAPGQGQSISDDLLRLIFTCCHPVLSQDAQVALTLREVCGLTTEEIAHAYLIPVSSLAQRIVRAKARIREARIPYSVPDPDDFPERLEAVLRIIYLVFNEGYAASSGDTLTRPDLSAEAIRLGRLLTQMLPETEAVGLLALMLLQESRRNARTSPSGDLVLLENQDRSLWNREQIDEGRDLAARAMSSQRIGTYTLQAAIASVHAYTPRAEETDWARIVGLYDLLMVVDPSPVVELNRAAAIAMRDGPRAGLVLIEAILRRGDLSGYHLAHAARADIYRRLGNRSRARACYADALELARQAPERRFLQARLRELQD